MRRSLQLLFVLSFGILVSPAHAQMGHPFMGMEIDAAADVADLDALSAALPENIEGWSRAATNSFLLAGEPIPVAEALYERGDDVLAVAIADLHAVKHDFMADWRRLAEEGHAREIRFGDVPGFEGTGTSDDVAPPHGVMAFIDGRFQLNIAEMNESLRSVSDLSSLPENELRAMIERARSVMQRLDLEALAEQALGAAVPTAGDGATTNAPEGFEAYAADWPGTRVSVAYPSSWTLVDLHERTDFMPVLVIMRSAEVAVALYGEGTSISTELEGRLVMPDNVIIDVSYTGIEASSMSPLDFLVSTDAPPLNDPEVIGPPELVTVDGRDAAVIIVRGTDADDHPLVLQQWVLESGGHLVAVHAFLPASEPEATASMLRTILSTIQLNPR